MVQRWESDREGRASFRMVKVFCAPSYVVKM